MPELPEVEHTRQKLERWMRGARVVEVTTSDARLVRPLAPRAFVARLGGAVVRGVDRKGKWLRLRFAARDPLFVHLGMTGWFVDEPAPRFARVIFELERRGRRRRVTYVDPRRWGRLVVAAELAAWDELGPDPLADGIDPARLQAELAGRRTPIKVALLDQRLLAGVGNIQAIEALWKARLDPRSPAEALGRSELRALAAGLRWTIARTLADLARGDALGSDDVFRVYGRAGTPCPRCRTTLVRLVLAGRTTVLCPGCQRRLSR